MWPYFGDDYGMYGYGDSGLGGYGGYDAPYGSMPFYFSGADVETPLGPPGIELAMGFVGDAPETIGPPGIELAGWGPSPWGPSPEEMMFAYGGEPWGGGGYGWWG